MNPGRHKIEAYTFDGELETSWGTPATTIGGFSGCCNPTHIAMLPDGSFVTSEKGLARVKVYDSTWTIHSRELWLNTETRVGRAIGPLDVEDAFSRLDGAAGVFDLGTNEGTVEDVEAEYAPWRIRGRQARVDRRREIFYTGARFTSCNAGRLSLKGPIPDYHFRATSMHVKPKCYLTAWNARFYLGRVPLFYFPFLWKSLDPDPTLRTRFEFGHDNRGGYFTRTTTLYSPGRAWQGKLYLDYYSLLGLGVGNQLEFNKGPEAHGTLYGYQIADQRTGTRRWTLLGDHYQTFASSWAVQGRLQAQSDPDFNNDYTRSNAFRVTQQLANSAALVRRTNTYTTRLSYSRLDDADPARPNIFLKTSETLPRLDVQTAALKPLGLPALHTFSAFAERDFARGQGFQQNTAGGAWEVTQNVRVARRVSFTPRGALSETYLQRYDVAQSSVVTQSFLDTFTGRFDLGGTLRLSSFLGDTDLTELFRRRLKPDSFETDAGAVDYGIESNLVSLTHAFRPNPRVYTKLTTGYDLRNFRGQTIQTRDRVQPIGADLTWLFSRRWSFAVHDAFRPGEGNQNIFLEADWDDLNGRFARFGVANIRPPAGQALPANVPAKPFTTTSPSSSASSRAAAAGSSPGPSARM